MGRRTKWRDGSWKLEAGQQLAFESKLAEALDLQEGRLFYSPTLGPKNHSRSADCSKVERHWEDVAEEYRKGHLEGTWKGDLEGRLGRAT